MRLDLQAEALGEEGDEDEDEEDDPWALLDPHDPGKTQPKPFRKGR